MSEGFSEPLADHGAWEYEPATQSTRWSDGLYRIHGVAAGEFEPTVPNVRPLVHSEDRERYAGVVRDAIATKSPFTCQHRIVRPDGDTRIVIVRGSYVRGVGAAQDRLIGTTQDVTGREGEEEMLWHLANHDSLSGLFNRRRFMEELTRELAISTRNGVRSAVLMLDLDHFKDINDSLGHQAGDSLLTTVGEALRSRLRATDILARIGGDEFAIVLPDCSLEAAEFVAKDLLKTLSEQVKIKIGGIDRPIHGSMGVTSFGPGASRSADELLVEADLAMYRAKATGRGGVQIFGEEMRAELAARVSVEGELRKAIDSKELSVQYQPIISLKDGTTVACEALVRWEHPVRGMVGPTEFVPIAEETGLISEIGSFVLTRACRQAAEWRRRGNQISVSVNVSPLQLTRSDLVSQVSRTLSASALPAELLCLEVTETSLIRDTSPVLDTMRGLKDLGVRISMDDFGGGASSLGLLRILPIDQIKIDRLFVQGITQGSNDRAIVAAVISLAKELGLSIVAEGVETTAQQGELRELGAEFAQGFLYSTAKFPKDLELDGYSATVTPGVGDPSTIREFMRQIGIPARIDHAEGNVPC